MTTKVFSLAFLAIMFSLIIVSANDMTLSKSTIDLKNPSTSVLITLNPLNVNETEFASYAIDKSMWNLTDINGNPITLSVTASDLTNINTSQTLNVTLNNLDYSNLELGKTYSSYFEIKDDEGNYTKKVTINVVQSYCSNGNQKTNYIEVDYEFNNIEGFGEDEDEWYPLDKIELSIDVENTWSDDIDDVVVEWCLYSIDQGKCVADDKESSFRLKEDDEENILIEFQIDPEDLDKDSNNYKFYIKVYSEDSEFGEDNLCEEFSEDVSILFDDNFVVFGNVDYTQTIPCGSYFELSADAWNIGDDDEEDVYVVVYNKELGWNEKIEIGDIDQLESEGFSFSKLIPKEAKEGTYFIDVRIFNEDDDIFENDNDDEAKFVYSFNIEGNCISNQSQVNARISAQLDEETPEAVAGKKLLINSNILNTGNLPADFTISVVGNSQWSNLDSINPKTFVLGAGESKDVVIALDVLENVSGDYEFTIVADYEGKTTQQKVAVSILESQKENIEYGKIVNHIKENWFIYLIVLINVILIIAIIAVIKRMTRPRQSVL